MQIDYRLQGIMFKIESFSPQPIECCVQSKSFVGITLSWRGTKPHRNMNVFPIFHCRVLVRFFVSFWWRIWAALTIPWASSSVMMLILELFFIWKILPRQRFLLFDRSFDTSNIIEVASSNSFFSTPLHAAWKACQLARYVDIQIHQSPK